MRQEVSAFSSEAIRPFGMVIDTKRFLGIPAFDGVLSEQGLVIGRK
jgi:hypothetical protein